MSTSYPSSENSASKKIQAPNFTQIPNVVIDEWCSILNPYSFKLLICLCRKTFGWHKTSDTISKNQLIKLTGMSKHAIQSALEELLKFDLIIVHKNQNEYGHQPNNYSLNIHKPEDEIYSDFPPGSTQYDLGVGPIGTQGVGPIGTPQKKDLTKETITKEKSESSPTQKKLSKEEKKQAKEESKKAYAEFVRLTEEEYNKLIADNGKDKLQWMLDKLNAHKQSSGQVYKSDYGTMIKGGWVQDAFNEKKEKLTGKKESLPIVEKEKSIKKQNPPMIFMLRKNGYVDDETFEKFKKENADLYNKWKDSEEVK